MGKIIKINEGTPKEKVIGELDTEKKVFKKKVKLHTHLFKKLDAWGIDANFFTDVLFPNDYLIEILEQEEQKRYTIDAKVFKKYGTYYHFKNKTNDYGAQLFCPRHRFLLTNIII